MNSAMFDTYDVLRVEVLAYIESRTCSRMTETKVQKHDKTRDDPMDVDSVVKGKGKNKFSGECYHYGKVGHKAAECWSRDRISNKGSGKNSSANVASSSKGKSKGKSQGKGKSKRPAVVPWSSRRSFGRRPMTRSRKNGGTHGVKMRNQVEMKPFLGPM